MLHSVAARTTFFRAIIVVFLALLTALATPARAAQFRPVITNYTPTEYGQNAGLQNWDCTQDDNGILYFANNRGLLVFDGNYWEHISEHDNTLVRSVHAIGDRIYAGSYARIGYYSRDPYGALRYTPLEHLIRGYKLKHEESWNIVEHDGKVFFQSFSSIIVYDPKGNDGQGTAYAIADKKQSPLYLHKSRGRLWLQLINGGYCSFDGRHCRTIFPRSAVGDDDVVANIAIGHHGAMLLATTRHGLYQLERDGSVRHFATDIDAHLQRENVNRMTIIGNHTIVIGTILGGIYAIDLQGRMLWHYRMADGLVNNSVLRLFCDASHNVWACLDGGIALIHSGLALTYLSPAPWDQPIGMVYDIYTIDRQLLMATNQGLYSYPLDATEASPQLLSGTQGQNWHITPLGQQLFVGSNNTTYEYRGGGLSPVGNFSTSSTSIQECRIHGQHVLLETSYSTLRIYRQDASGQWRPSHNVAGHNAPLRNCVVTDDGEIWAANMHKGYFRLRLSRDLRRIEKSTFAELLDSSSTTSVCYVMSIKGHVVIADQQRLYIYDDMQDRIVPYERLNAVLPSSGEVHSATPWDGGYWIGGKWGYAYVKEHNGNFNLQRYVPLAMTGLLSNDTQATINIEGHHAYFNMANGVVCYDLARHPEPRRIKPHITLVSAHYHTSDGSEQRLVIDEMLKGHARVETNISLRFSYPDYDHLGLRFRFTLIKGSSERVTVQDIPLYEVNNLNYGRYTLRVEAVTDNGKVIDTLETHFRVRVPWYLSFWAFVCYIALVTAMAWSYGRIQTRRALAQQKATYEAEAREQHIKVLEQERVIAEQQRQILETELSSQSKELASLALDALSKEQVIDSLRDTMKEEQQRGSRRSQRDLTPLLHRMRQAEGNLEFWNIYQKNFDLIHEHFFRNLQERYPQLTSSDLKFCALLRLNLSTKDIAKFANISVRGVESARLRLRKKFALTTDQNLVEFLIAMK